MVSIVIKSSSMDIKKPEQTTQQYIDMQYDVDYSGPHTSMEIATVIQKLRQSIDVLEEMYDCIEADDDDVLYDPSKDPDFMKDERGDDDEGDEEG